MVREYRDSDALLSKLGDYFLQGFDDALHQVKKAYLDLDISNIKIEDQAQTSVMPVASEDTDDLFAKDEVLGDGELAQAQSVQAQNVQAQNVQTQPVVEVAHQPVNLVEQV